MSYTQNDTVLQQRHLQQQVQQRQILAMMGIGLWIQPSSATLNIADVAHSTETAHIDQPSVDNPVSQSMSKQDAVSSDAVNLTASPLVAADSEWANNVDTVTHDSDAVAARARQDMPTVADVVAPLVEQTTAPTNLDAFDNANFNNVDNATLDQVAAFDLQGGRYNNWVLIVDIQALNSDSQKLWQNITQALSLECDTISFPICAGMDTAELANASLAGYLFKIGRSEESQVAALTELPAGLTHPNLVSVVTLDAMLADSTLKRQLWEQISQ